MAGRLLLDVLILAGDVSLAASLISVYNQLKSTKTAAAMSLLTLSTIVFSRFLHSLSQPIFGLHFNPSTLPLSLYVLMDWANVFIGIYVLYFFVKYLKTYDPEEDNFGAPLLQWLGKNSVKARWVMFHSSIIILAVAWNYWRRSDRGNVAVAFYCSYYEVIGFFALLPQLWMFQRDKIVNACLGNFIILTAVQRFFTLCIWLLFPFIYSNRYLDNRSTQMASEILNLVIMSDFIYYYCRSKVRGDKDILIGESPV